MTLPIRPITPEEVTKEIPDFVVEAVNELINEKSGAPGRTFTILQDDIKQRVMSKTNIAFDFKWLDFEPLYESYGWRVRYDKPAYNEFYDAYFEFRPKTK